MATSRSGKLKIKIKKAKSGASISAPSAVSPVSSSRPLPASKIRAYLPIKKGRYYDPDDPDTPEGRLSKYNQEDWLAPAKNTHDHSKSVTLDFPEEVINELSKHCNSGKFPLNRSIQQAIRVAVLEFLQVLRRLEPLTDSHMALIEIMTLLNANAVTTAQYEDQFNTGRQNVYHLMTLGAQNEARKMVADMIALAKRIPVRELKQKYLHLIQREFKGLLKAGSKSVKTNVRKNATIKRLRKQQMASNGNSHY